MKSARLATNIIGHELFQSSLITYLLLTLAESLKDGYVSNFFNLNYLLLVVLVTGVAMVLTDENKPELIRRFRRRTAQAVINIAVKSAFQAKAAREAAIRHAQAIRQTNSFQKTTGVKGVTAIDGVTRLSPKIFPQSEPIEPNVSVNTRRRNNQLVQ